MCLLCRLLIASQDGYLYVYSIPSVEGQECQLIKRHDLRLEDNYAMDVKGAHTHTHSHSSAQN